MEEPTQVEFKITVKITEQEDKVNVFIGDAFKNTTNEAAPFVFYMAACEYLLHRVAQKSSIPYEDAMTALVKGAMTYRNVEQPND